MLKKSTALFLSYLMLLVFGQGMAAFALMPQTVEEHGAKWTDDFNRWTSADTISTQGYPRLEDYNQTSDVFEKKAGFYASFVDNGGRDGSTAMKLLQNQQGNNVMLATKALDMTSGSYDAFVFCHEFQIMQNPEILTTFYLGARSGWGGRQFQLEKNSDGDFILKNAQGTQTYAYSLHTWYKLIVMQTAKTRCGWLLDAASGELLMSNQTTYAASSVEDATVIVGALAKDYTQTMQVMVDSAELYAYKMESYPPSVTAQSMTSGATGVSTAEGSVEITFDQPIATLSASIYPTNAPEKAAACTAEAVAGKMNTYRVAWGSLQGSTNYTLDLTGFQNGGGAASDVKITFTTEESGFTVLTDSFDDAKRFNRYGYDTNTTHDGWFGTGQYCTTAGNISQSADGGYSADGSKNSAMQLKRLGAGGYTIKSHDKLPLAADETLVETYRIKINDKGAVTSSQNTSGQTVYSGDFGISFGVRDGLQSNLNDSATIAGIGIHPNTGNLIINGAGYATASGAELLESRWYNLILSVRQTEHTLRVTDTVTGGLVWENTLFTDGVRENTGNNTKKIQPFTNGVQIFTAVVRGGAVSTQETLLDDVSLWRIKPEVEKHKLALVSADENAQIDKDGSISMTFNQPVLSNSGAMMLYRGKDKNEPAYSTVSVSHTDFCTQKLSFSSLYSANDYTLDYSGMTAVSGADLGEAKVSSVLPFSTKASENDLEIVSEIACGGLSAGDKLIFDAYSKNAGSQEFIAAFYSRGVSERLIGLEKLTVSLSGGRQTVEVPLSKAYPEAGCAKIFAWDSSLRPLMKDGRTTVPTETLDVLMIGNSLSEDAGRYLNNIAAADGLNLNLTVKGVGGATLQNHADNLKAELDGRTAAEARALMEAGSAERLLYFTYENGAYQTATDENSLLLNALKAKQYDVISLQQFSAYADTAFADLPYLMGEIRKLQPDAEIMLYQTWSPYSSTLAQRNSYFTTTIEPAIAKWAKAVPTLAEGITKGNEPITIIPSGRAFYLADNKYEHFGAAYGGGAGNTDPDAQQGSELEQKFAASTGLWRDYNHASFYGCYLTDAIWYETLTGKIAPVGTEGSPVIAAPNGISQAEHLKRLQQLRDVAHQVILEQKKA